jgi:hypothetical protein
MPRSLQGLVPKLIQHQRFDVAVQRISILIFPDISKEQEEDYETWCQSHEAASQEKRRKKFASKYVLQ